MRKFGQDARSGVLAVPPSTPSKIGQEAMSDKNKAPLVAITGGLAAVLCGLVAIALTQQSNTSTLAVVLPIGIVMLVVMGVLVGTIMKEQRRGKPSGPRR